MILSVRCRRTVQCAPRQAMGFHWPAAREPKGLHLPVVSPSQGFHSPAASESLSFACPLRRRSGANSAAGPKGAGQDARSQESNQRKSHHTLAPSAQFLCSRSASLRRGSPTVHPGTGVELAHIVWAILRTFPSQARRDRGGPGSAHRARQSNCQSQRQSQSQSQSQSHSQSQSPPHPPNVPLLRHALRAGSTVRFGILPSQSAPPPARGEGEEQRDADACGNMLWRCSALLCSVRLRFGIASALLRHCCAGCAVNGAPMRRQRDVGKARRVGARDCAQFDVSPGMNCRRTPGVALRSRRAGCPETAASGWPFSWSLLFGHSKRSDSLAGRRVKSRHGCRAPKERALNKCALKQHSPQIPESAGMATVGKRANPRQEGRAGQSK